ncbi:protein bric-a-brac 2 isoform X2 [Anabrus simplex]|uniref:protein bric-a-brac 2 isoform X2 n=1 Tax=Anabrus simplex TaxID=316456 RepID=UPI0035A2F907
MTNLYLKWSSHLELLTSLVQLLEESSFVDVTIAVEGQLLKAHKIILCASSSYFRAILESHPASHPVIFMRDVKHTEMKAILDFIYKGEACVSQENLHGILKTADALKITGLSSIAWSDLALNSTQDGDPFENDKECIQEVSSPEKQISSIGHLYVNEIERKDGGGGHSPTTVLPRNKPSFSSNSFSPVIAVSDEIKEDSTLLMQQDMAETEQKPGTESLKASTTMEISSEIPVISLVKHKPPYRRYTKDDLQQALNLVRQGQMGIKPAARAFNIPVATLNHAARRNKITSPMQQGGNHTSFKSWLQNKGGTSSVWDSNWN